MYDYLDESIINTMTGGFIVFYLALMIFFIAVYWKLFTKAGEPGWACIVPIYNAIVMLRIAGKPWWWIFMGLLAIIPFVGWIVVLVLSILIMHGLSTNFGKDSGFTVGLVLLPIVFVPILAFGSAQYMSSDNVQNVDSIEDLNRFE